MLQSDRQAGSNDPDCDSWKAGTEMRNFTGLLTSALVVVTLQLSTPAQAANKVYSIKNVGGTLGVHADDDLTIRITPSLITITASGCVGKKEYEVAGVQRDCLHRSDILAQFSPSAVTDVSYGSKAHQRVGAGIALGFLVTPLGGAIVASTSSVQHFVGLNWEYDGKEGGAVIEADKGKYRAIVSKLESATGRTAVDTDEPDNKTLSRVTGGLKE
jgi:hypothetical protein